MHPRPLRLAALFFALLTPFAAIRPLAAQMAGTPPQAVPAPAAAAASPARRQAPRPAKDAKPGGAPDLVWVNMNSSTYHCFGDRYYGKTANGRYMKESAAKAAGAKGAGGRTCSAAK